MTIEQQKILFWRLYQETKEAIEERGGYIRPFAHLYWRDGRRSDIVISEKETNLNVAEFIEDLDNYCVENDVYIAYVCFPLPRKQYYFCLMTGLDWNGAGMARQIFLREGVAIEAETKIRSINDHEEFFKEFRFKSAFNKESVGRC